ncbi:hypothetical protein FRC14_001325 [Serendipita sp. 396]|nr:hypothetical protein FRC14_001325 [Serendipita sp. 396]KAG8783732.1 hypothetical protein FRC15_004627 [Serendipita sp. 397]KAG8869264.1 hypothetical protein FRC20_001843 [Serendipita sp. 405]
MGGGQPSSDLQRQLDALNHAERLRASSVSSTGMPSVAAPATGNIANSSGQMLSATNNMNTLVPNQATSGSNGMALQPSQAQQPHQQHPQMQTPQPALLINYLSATNPNIAPIFQPDEARGGRVVLMKLLAELHSRKNQALPPAFTGVASVNWNPENSPFKFDISGVGIVRIGGHDVDLLKLWQAVFGLGMSTKVTRENLWGQIAAQLGLPPILNDGITTSASQIQILFSYVTDLEIFLMRIMQSAQLRAQQARMSQPQQPPQPVPGADPNAHQPATPISSITTMGTPAASATPGPATPAQGSSDGSGSGKRKAEGDDDDEAKRKLRKIDEDGGSQPTSANPDAEGSRASPVKEEPPAEAPLFRRKIQYVPVMRTINTAGGRDLEAINHEHYQLPAKRPMRKMEDFGLVDVEALVLQLRSRLKVDMTTALGILYHLSYVRGGDTGNSGLNLKWCEDLTDELLDVLEETAFNAPDIDDPEDAEIKPSTRIVTNREITRTLYDTGHDLFAGLKIDEEVGPNPAPTHQSWEVVTIIVTILSNAASADDNPAFLAGMPRLLDVITRVCMIEPALQRGDMLRPVSHALQLRHLSRIRKECVNLIGAISRFVQLSSCPPRTTRRLYLLLASTLMDSEECVAPGSGVKAPAPMMDLALECFSNVAHLDSNRKVITTQIPWDQLWSLMQMVSRTIPISDTEVQHAVTEVWMSFIFKAALVLYSLAVCAPLPMRRKMKLSPSLRTALVRFLRTGLTIGSQANNLYRSLNPEVRGILEEYWRRIGETLKVIDAEEDPLAPTTAAGGLIGYGIGGSYDLHLGAKPPARGTGMFAGARAELLWSVMSGTAAQNDLQAFEEWDYMLRVDSSTASRVS